MKAYEDYLTKEGFEVSYISSIGADSDIRLCIDHLKKSGITGIRIYEPCDDWLGKRITSACNLYQIDLEKFRNPLFLDAGTGISDYTPKRGKYFQAEFYQQQRKSRKILVDDQLNPLHAKWSFDSANRLKYPKNKRPPVIAAQFTSPYHNEAAAYVGQYFSSNRGTVDNQWFQPVTHKQAEKALTDFLAHRFKEFGDYEDAIVRDEMYLHHSVLSPLLNTGLLLPEQVMEDALDYARANDIPYNSLEGFIRQILGWREYIRMVYIREGGRQRTRNFWGFKRKIPVSFYTGDTGIDPVDTTIKKLNKSAYNHHIERLMILSNFMLLCEFDPDEVYRWFMEMYIDAYDWVMVPNVYGMGQFADGGLMCTKPYISGSNYIFKMSDYPKDAVWAEIWDALFWRFIHVHRSFFQKNPRLGVLVKNFDKWQHTKQESVISKAKSFLNNLDQSN